MTVLLWRKKTLFGEPSDHFKLFFYIHIYILYIYMGVSKNMGKPPNHPFVHRVFHYFNHPFWVPLFLETTIYTLPETNSKSTCQEATPKGKDDLPTIHASFGEGIIIDGTKDQELVKYKAKDPWNIPQIPKVQM